MIFAAGFGTRMRPLTLDRPKPLIKVAGQTLLDRAIDLGTAAGCAPMVVNAHYKAAMIDAHLANTHLTVLTEAPDILDTGGGLRNARTALGADVAMTLNPDVLWAGPNPLSALQAAWDPARMDALLMTVPLAQTIGRAGTGDFDLDGQGHISRGTTHVYGGAQILKLDRLDTIAETVFSLNHVWDLVAADTRLFGLPYPGTWCDVGTPEGIRRAEAMLAEHHG